MNATRNYPTAQYKHILYNLLIAAAFIATAMNLFFLTFTDVITVEAITPQIITVLLSITALVGGLTAIFISSILSHN